MSPFRAAAHALACLAVAGLCTLHASAAAPRWTIADTGALGSGGSRATVVNNRGDVAGTSFKGLFNHGFIWRDGVLSDLGLPSDSPQIDVYGINASGVIVAEGLNQSVYLWRDGTWTKLPFTGSPNDINGAGAIVGAYNVGPAGVPHAFLFRDGIFHDLGTGPGYASVAWAINDGGTIAGTLYDASFTSHAFVWDNGAFHDIGTLGGRQSSAADINNQGTVVGAANTADGRTLAFVYDRAGMRALFDRAGNSAASAINARGAVVGTFAQGAFLYEDGVLTTLETIPEVQAAGWTRLFPQEINDRGWIVGFGVHAAGGPPTGFVLMPR